VLIGVTVLLIKGIEGVYPLYKHFYASNAYNVKSYFLAFTALAVVIYTLCYRWLLSKFSMTSLLAGILLLEIKILVLMYVAMPTAIFFFLFPLIFSITGNILFNSGVFKTNLSESSTGLIHIAFLLPAILWLSPAIRQMYVIFGLSIPVAAVVLIIGLLLGLLLPVFNIALTTHFRPVLYAAIVIFIAALIGGQLQSGYTPDRPLQSNVFYQYRADEKKAYWMSEFLETDQWNKQFFPHSKVEKGLLVNEAPVIELSIPEAIVMEDTIQDNIRKLSIHFRSRRDAITMRIDINDKNPGYNAIVMGPAGGSGNVYSKEELRVISYNGLDSAGVDIMFETKPGVPFELTVLDRTMGLPSVKALTPYPSDVVPGTGWRANTTQVLKSFSF
jgi:hypothetical protein